MIKARKLKSSNNPSLKYCLLLIYVAFNRLRVASEGAIVVLTDYMKNRDNDIIGRQYCAMALGNLAAEPENHMEIIKSEGK
jgi:hypothetical protein